MMYKRTYIYSHVYYKKNNLFLINIIALITNGIARVHGNIISSLQYMCFELQLYLSKKHTL